MRAHTRLPDTRLLMAGLLLFSLFIIHQSCTKIDTSMHVSHALTDAEITQKFFNVPADAPLSVRRAADEMRKRNAQDEYIVKFARENGYPVWDKAIISYKENTQANFSGNSHVAAGEDTTVILPLVPDGLQRVTGFVSANESDSIRLDLYRGGDYSRYSFENLSGAAINADKAVLQLMVLNKLVFGYTNFQVSDNRLFSNDNQYNPAARPIRVSLKDTGTQNLHIACQVYEITVYFQYWDGDVFLYEIPVYSFFITIGNCGSETGSGGGGPSTLPGGGFPISTGPGGPSPGSSTPGDSGGGGGSPSNYPCPSSMDRTIQAMPCGVVSVPPIVPAQHNVTVQMVTNTINPNFPCLVSAFNNITKPRLTSCLYQLYDQTFVGTGNVHNLEITSYPQVVDGFGVPVPAASRRDPNNINKYIIYLNESDGTYYTQEFWSAAILHELVHGFILKNNLDFSPSTQFSNAHEIMLKSWVDEMKEVLMECYPSMSETDALCLAINGMSDVLQSSALAPTVKTQMQQWMEQHYTVSINTVAQTSHQYMQGSKGTPCN